MLKKRCILSLLILIGINFSIFANFGLDLGLNYDSVDADSPDAATNEFPFSVVALPSFSSGKFSVELNTPIKFKFEDGMGFDFSNYALPESKDNFLDTSLAYTKYFLNFINYLQWGSFTEDFAIRIGKITNSTIGDGALLYHYKDESVCRFETKPGLHLKFDGNMLNLPFGAEFISNDLFDSTLVGGRMFVNPIFFIENNLFNKLQIGYTTTYNKRINESNITQDWFNFVYDLQLPIYKNPENSIITYYDLISEIEIDKDDDSLNRMLSQRYGIQGWYLKSFTYDAHIKNFVSNNAALYMTDFGKGNWDLFSKTIIPQFKKDFIISAYTGYYSNNGLTEYTFGSQLGFNDLQLSDYNLKLVIKSAKAIGPVSGITASLVKNYILNQDTDEFSESFFEGLVSAKNLDINLSANIIFYKVNAITVNMRIIGDESGSIKPTYSLGYKLTLL